MYILIDNSGEKHEKESCSHAQRKLEYIVDSVVVDLRMLYPKE